MCSRPSSQDLGCAVMHEFFLSGFVCGELLPFVIRIVEMCSGVFSASRSIEVLR